MVSYCRLLWGQSHCRDGVLDFELYLTYGGDPTLYQNCHVKKITLLVVNLYFIQLTDKFVQKYCKIVIFIINKKEWDTFPFRLICHKAVYNNSWYIYFASYVCTVSCLMAFIIFLPFLVSHPLFNIH